MTLGYFSTMFIALGFIGLCIGARAMKPRVITASLAVTLLGLVLAILYSLTMLGAPL